MENQKKLERVNSGVFKDNNYIFIDRKGNITIGKNGKNIIDIFVGFIGSIIFISFLSFIPFVSVIMLILGIFYCFKINKKFIAIGIILAIIFFFACLIMLYYAVS